MELQVRGKDISLVPINSKCPMILSICLLNLDTTHLTKKIWKHYLSSIHIKQSELFPRNPGENMEQMVQIGKYEKYIVYLVEIKINVYDYTELKVDMPVVILNHLNCLQVILI